jgi:glucitol operon activator protein
MSMVEQLALVALAAWLLQLGLAYRQARLFYKRVSSLKKLGRCATGLSGGRYRGRTYVVIVVHPLTRLISKAEQLRGITVFAGLKPVAQLDGRSLDELLNPNTSSIEGLSPRVIEAARSAAEAIQKSFDKDKVSATA